MTNLALTQHRASALGALLAAVLSGAIAGGIFVAVVFGGPVVDLAPGGQAPALTQSDADAPGFGQGPAGGNTDAHTRFDRRSWSEPMPE